MTARTRNIAQQLVMAAPRFKASGGVLRSDENGITRLILVERGKYTTVEENPVTLMLGVLSLRAIELLGSSVQRELRRGPMEWPWSRRIGHVRPDRKDVWWDLGPESSAAEDSGLQALRQAVQDHALPALSRVSTERALFEAIAERFDRHGDALPYHELRSFTALAQVLGEAASLAAGIAAMETCGIEDEQLRDDLARLR